MTDLEILLFILGAVGFIGAFALTFVSSVFLHELGHILVLRKYSRKARVYFHKVDGKLKLHAGKEEDYLGLSNEQLEAVYISGIFLGIIPICLFSIFTIWGFALGAIYLIGCRSDFQKLKQLEEGN